MTPASLFPLLNGAAMAGWILLLIAILFRLPRLRDLVAGLAIPAALSACYAAIVVVVMPGSDGGFGSLGAVARLFASEWMLLAGWIHYLAFDLFVGAWIARRLDRAGLHRAAIAAVMPFAFLVGPIGLLAYLVLSITLDGRSGGGGTARSSEVRP